MDYRIGLFLKGFIFIIGNLNGSYCEIERDLILTPKLALHINGKTLYYKPSTSIINSNTTTPNVPWEQTLKHVSFLTLHNDLEEIKDLNNFIDYKNFMNSSYIPSVNFYIPKFGDIITLARGRLEKITNKNEYRFIEGECNKNCDLKNILAYWQVQKIRHRDFDRKFRYEIKFSINPRIIETNGKREINRVSRQSHILKSFILKDDDYPNSFTHLDEHIAQKRYDDNRNIYLERLNAFNEVFTHPRYFDINRNLDVEYNRQNNLNIGEYMLPNRKNFIPQSDSLSRISIYNNLPTTYRPNYHLKFTKPYINPNPYYSHNQQSTIRYPEHEHNQQNIPINNKIPITTHLHHHYYLKNKQNNQVKPRPAEEQQLTFEPTYQQYNQDTIDLIQQPLSTLSPPKQNIYISPSSSSILNQIPIPPREHKQSHDQHIYSNNQNPILPSPPLFYMHPIPISAQLPLYLYPNTNQQSAEQSNGTPFRESYRIENPIQYSEPDPLYKNNREYKENYRNDNYVQSETTKTYDNTVNTEVNNFSTDIVENLKENIDEKYTKPDSINAQLPAPDDDTDLTIPYVENSSATESSYQSPSQLFVQKQIEQPTHQTTIPASITTTTSTSTMFQPTKIYPTLKRSNNLEISNGTNPKQLRTELPNKPINPKKIIRISTTLQPRYSNINTESSALKYVKPTTIQSKEIISQTSTSVKPSYLGNDKSIVTTTKKMYHRSTTERPVLKWKPKPKRAKITKESKPIFTTTTKSVLSKFEFERVPVNVTERVFTVTPSNKNNISTKKSVSKSISIKVGKENNARPFTPKIKIPNVEVFEADIIKLNTTEKGIKFFKAFSGRDETEKTKENDIAEAELTQSIVEHVKSL